MEQVCQSVQKQLFSLQDTAYRAFHSKLIPTVDSETIIGVRTPALRKFASDFAKTPEASVFLKQLPHDYYEENNLHSFLIEKCRDYEETIRLLDDFLPYVDNWATCDMMSPKIFGKHLPELLLAIRRWIASDRCYTVRYGIGLLMNWYLDGAFSPDYPALVAGVQSKEYYVNMMIAWYFATALAKQYQAVLPYFENRRLSPWTHNKAIQKAVESRRITDEQKSYLKTLKVAKTVE